MYITANGNVLPCCISPFVERDYDSLILGNAFEQPLSEIWKPFLAGSRPVLMSLGTLQFYDYSGGMVRVPDLDRALAQCRAAGYARTQFQCCGRSPSRGGLLLVYLIERNTSSVEFRKTFQP